MVGLVIVSHSRTLATAACDLVRQASQAVPLVGVGGVQDGEGWHFGTDAVAIKDAIESVYSTDGVLLLMDMGSALLSAETALALLAEQQTVNVRLCWAPLIEGAMAAAVQAGLGLSLAEVQKEAENALEPKRDQLGGGSTQPQTDSAVPHEATVRAFLISNKNGLHTRPAARMVQQLSCYQVEAFLSKSPDMSCPASLRSLNAVAMLNVRQGETVYFACWGRDTEAFLAQMQQLIESQFGESDEKMAERELTAAQCSTSTKLQSVSPGLAMGIALRREDPEPVFLQQYSDAPEEEHVRLQQLLDKTAAQLADRGWRAAVGTATQASRDLLAMHQLLLADPSLAERTRSAILNDRLTAECAWWQVCQHIMEEYHQLDNPYLCQRAADVRSVAIALLRQSERVRGLSEVSAQPQETILFVDEMTPGVMLSLPGKNIVGVVCKRGGGDSHAAIMARSFALPMVSGYQSTIKNGVQVVLDASTPRLLIAPSAVELESYRQRLEDEQQRRYKIEKVAHHRATSLDDVAVGYYANISGVQEAASALEKGATAVGLLRSELLFLHRDQPPSESEQYESYCQTMQVLNGRALTVRIFDIGGDKHVPYFNTEREANPFLGVRGIRLALRHRPLLLQQVRALLRAAQLGPLRIMLPMVVDETEIQQFREIFAESVTQLEQERLPFSAKVPVGIMVETPAAAQRSEILARHADFFSIGSNDLTQYLLAAERGHPELAHLTDCCHPAVLMALADIVANVHGSIEVSLCGEMAGDPEAIPLLLGVGLRHFSMAAPRIPQAKYLVEQLDSRQCSRITQRAMDMASAKEIRTWVRQQCAPVRQLVNTCAPLRGGDTSFHSEIQSEQF